MDGCTRIGERRFLCETVLNLLACMYACAELAFGVLSAMAFPDSFGLTRETSLLTYDYIVEHKECK
jgi:hypothetical protein